MAPRRTLVREVNPHLICVLCRGYFIEATTITECLHSFCRSCLVKYLGTSKFCPICDVQLHKNNPLLSVRCDPTLQQLVYKLIPGLYANEMARRRKYYSELGGPSSDPDCGEYPVGDAYFSPEDSISLSLEFTTTSSGKDEEPAGSEAEDSLVDKQGGLHRRYLQCPAAVTMSHLQKFLRMKYGFSHEVKVDIIYDGEVLSDEFSLMDVAYTFNWQRTAPMRFKFRLLQKSDVPSKGCGIERTKKPVEVKDDEIVQKPIAEAKVFAFAHVPPKTSPSVQKNSQCQTAAMKNTEEPKMAPVQKQEPKEVKPSKESIREPVTPKEDKPCRIPASKEGKELKSLKDLKPRNVPTFEKVAEKGVSGISMKRPHQNEGPDSSFVETKKLKIVLEPLPILKQEKKKSVPVKPEVVKVQPVEPKPQTSPKDVEKRHETKKQMIYAPEKSAAKDTSRREAEKAKPTKQPVPAVAEDEDEEEEPNYMDDIIQEDDYDDDDVEDRLHISPIEEDVTEEKADPMDVEKEEIKSHGGAKIEAQDERMTERELAKYARSEERRKEKKRNKKAKHHHHRHHDRKRDSPPIATILHSPDNDLKLKFKLTNSNTKPKYTIMDNNDSKREYTSHSSPKHQDKYNDREFKNKVKEPINEASKKPPSPVINNNYNNLNNNNNNLLMKAAHAEPEKVTESGSKERSFQLKMSKQKVVRSASPAPKAPSPKITASVQNKPCPIPSPLLNSSPKPKTQSPQQIPIMKQNGATAVKTETIKMPPSSITVSKITAAEKAHMEQQKLLMNRNNSLGLDSKRPSLEIMLVNAPKKAGAESSGGESKPVEVKKVMRPTPPSIPLSRLKNFGSKGSPPPLVLANKSLSGSDENGALDLSGKSSRKSPDLDSMRNLVMLSNTAERMMSSLEPLKIPIPPNLGMGMKSGFQQTAPRTMKPGPNQTVRQIPNPSALMFRQHALNSQRSVPPSVPINSLRKMETMAKNINLEKVAAGLSVKAAVEAGYQPK